MKLFWGNRYSLAKANDIRGLIACRSKKSRDVLDGKPGLYRVTFEITQDDRTKKVEIEEFNTVYFIYTCCNHR